MVKIDNTDQLTTHQTIFIKTKNVYLLKKHKKKIFFFKNRTNLFFNGNLNITFQKNNNQKWNIFILKIKYFLKNFYIFTLTKWNFIGKGFKILNKKIKFIFFINKTYKPFIY